MHLCATVIVKKKRIQTRDGYGRSQSSNSEKFKKTLTQWTHVRNSETLKIKNFSVGRQLI